MVERYDQQTFAAIPSASETTGELSYHRHTTATHLLRAGLGINIIRAWLGHVSRNTTNVYAEVNLEMKTKALATCEVRVLFSQNTGRRRTDAVLAKPLKEIMWRWETVRVSP
jgi:integrase/recombinase XerD